MRTLRLSLIGTVILVLLGGLGVVAAAQDEPAATPVIGNITSTRIVASGDPTFGGMHNYLRDDAADYDMEWSDPRLGSVMRTTTNWDFFGLPEEGDINGAVLVATSVRLEGPDGAWTGTEYLLLDETRNPERYPGPSVMLLSGEGAYEGLSAMIRRQYESDIPMPGELPTFEGYILEGELTPVPTAPEPSTE
jgi:hypothetical protein